MMFALLGIVANAQNVVFYESFDQNAGTGGNDGQWSGNVASSTKVTYDNNGWVGTKVYGADKCIKLGTGSAQGSITTPAISLTGNGTLTFKAGAWSGDKSTISLSIANGGELSMTTIDLSNASFMDYTVEITNATANSTITFSANVASKNRFFLDEVKVVSAGEVDPNQVVAPTFSLTSGTYEGTQTLTLNCETEDATIYYTVNGEEALAYTGAIELTEGEYAFVAWAEKDGMTKSSEVTANYTIVAPLVANSIAEFLTLGAENTDRVITLNCDLTVLFQGGGEGTRDLYVKDATGKGLFIYEYNNPQFNKGDVIDGVKGKYKDFNGTIEMVSPVYGVVKETVEVAPVSVDASQLTVDNVNEYVVVNNVELSEINGANATLNDETATLALYNKYNACTYPEELNKKYFVTGIVSVYNNAVQIYPLEITVDTESSVNDAVANEFKAVAVVNGIEVNVAEAGLVSVYNAAGQLVANVNVAEGATTINVAGGFYIVKAGNNVAKVLVK